MDEQYEAPPGAVTIAPAVLTTIVRQTTLAHPGVLRLASRMPPSLPRKRGKAAQAEGLRVELFSENTVTVDVHVIADPNASLTDLGKDLQTQIARALEHMVGMQVRSVNVFIDEIEFEASPKGSP
jgi:uncharacterized alkaline shock family protein YloU